VARSSNPIGATVDKIHANSVTCGTSEWRKSVARSGSSPHARKSSASAVYAQGFRVAQGGESVVISDEIKRFAFGLERHGRLHHPKIIADVQHAGGLDAGQNAHGALIR
jgi:hypothetical protein